MDLVREDGCWLIERLWVSAWRSSRGRRDPFGHASAIMAGGTEAALCLRRLRWWTADSDDSGISSFTDRGAENISAAFGLQLTKGGDDDKATGT